MLLEQIPLSMLPRQEQEQEQRGGHGVDAGKDQNHGGHGTSKRLFLMFDRVSKSPGPLLSCPSCPFAVRDREAAAAWWRAGCSGARPFLGGILRFMRSRQVADARTQLVCLQGVRMLECGRTQASSEPMVHGLLLGPLLRTRRFGSG